MEWERASSRMSKIEGSRRFCGLEPLGSAFRLGDWTPDLAAAVVARRAGD